MAFVEVAFLEVALTTLVAGLFLATFLTAVLGTLVGAAFFFAALVTLAPFLAPALFARPTGAGVESSGSRLRFRPGAT